MGHLFAMALACLSFWRQNQDIALNKKPLVSSKRGFGFGRKRPYILAKARRTCWHEDHTDTLSKQFTAACAQSPWQCFWQDRFFLSLRHIQCGLFLPIAFLHTQKRHKWPWLNIYTSWQILVYGGWYPVSLWLIAKRTSLKADNATNIIQEGRIYHSKRELPLINACRWEQLQCCSKAIPTRGSTSRRESSGNLCGRHEVTLTQCLHEKSSRKEIDVPCQPCQIALEHFGLSKKKLPRIAGDVQN